MQQPRRFVLVGPVSPYRGGIAQFGETLWRKLEARGHAVTGVSFRRQYPGLLFPGTSQLEPAPRPDAPAAARLLDTLNPLSWRRAARYARQQQPDAVLFQHWMPFFAPAYGAMARRLPGVRRLALVHNALPHERRPGDAALTRYFVRACDAFLTLSDAVADDLERLGARGPVRRLRHPVYDRFGAPPPRGEARRRLGLPPGALVLLFFGLVRRYKGLDVLLEALPGVVARRPDTVLVVAGEFYEALAPYQAQIERLGLSTHVHVHPRFIPDEEVPLFFGAADLVVQPYRSATQSGVAQVAFHFERPLVITDVGGLAETVPDGVAGLVVPPDNPEALTVAIARFVQEPGLAARLQAGVASLKRLYGWDPLCEAIESLV